MTNQLDYKNVVITGTAGFIASHLAEYLVRKYPKTNFFGIDKLSYCGSIHNMDTYISLPNFKFFKADICDEKFISKLYSENNIDCVIHLAAYSAVDMSFENSMVYTKNNVEGTHVLLESAKNYGKIKRFIHMSTDEVYGSTIEFVKENTPFNPTNPYSATKAAAEMLCLAYINAYKLPIIITRANNIYGTRQYDEKVIPKFIHQILNCTPITIHGTGSVLRSFLHIQDFCRAYDLILREGKLNEIYNIGSEFEITIKELAERIIKYMRDISRLRDKLTNDEKKWLDNAGDGNNNLITFVPDRIHNDTSYHINCDKLKSLGWETKIKFSDGIINCISGYIDDFRKDEEMNL